MSHDGTRLSKPSSMALLRESNLPISAIIDVGVHYSSSDLIEAFPDKHHLLFEPVLEYEPHIKYAYRDVSNTLYNYAISDSDGVANLRVIDIEGGKEITHSFVVNEKGEKTRDVKMVSLDSFFAKEYDGPFKNDYLLKIDVDGHEPAILRGATETLQKCSAVIVETYPRDLLERYSLVANQGFILWDIIEPWYFHGRLAQVDLVFINKRFEGNDDLLPFNRKTFAFDKWKTIQGAV